MAWAKRLPSGRWQAKYRDAHGKERSAGTFDHKKRAEAAADEAERRARGTYWRDIDAGRKPWGEWADKGWWPARTVAPSTAKADRLRLENHLRPRWGHVPVAAITRTDVKRWAVELREAGLGPETVKRCVHLLSSSLAAAVDAEVIASNPAARMNLPGGGTDKERYLTRGEFEVLRAHMPTERDRFIVEMLAFTGMRWGELAGLHRARVDTARQMIRIVETFDETAGAMRPYPKGRKSRDVPLTAELAEKIDRMTFQGQDCGARHVTGRCVGPLLVTAAEGGPLRNSNWTPRVWTPALRHAGLGEVRKHDLRHTFASWLLQSGVPLAEVGRLLGHVSPTTTQRYASLAEVPSAAILEALSGGSAARLRHAGQLET